MKFFIDAMYYQFFIYNRDKFRIENPHERTIMLICGILFLPIVVIVYLLIKDNFDYKLPFVIFILIYIIMYRFLYEYYIKKGNGMKIVKQKPLLLNNQRFSVIISWMIYPLLVASLYFILKYRWLFDFLS